MNWYLGGYFGDFYPAHEFLGKFKAIPRSSKDHHIPEKDLIKEALASKKKKDTRYVLLLTKVGFRYLTWNILWYLNFRIMQHWVFYRCQKYWVSRNLKFFLGPHSLGIKNIPKYVQTSTGSKSVWKLVYKWFYAILIIFMRVFMVCRNIY